MDLVGVPGKFFQDNERNSNILAKGFQGTFGANMDDPGIGG